MTIKALAWRLWGRYTDAAWERWGHATDAENIKEDAVHGALWLGFAVALCAALKVIADAVIAGQPL